MLVRIILALTLTNTVIAEEYKLVTQFDNGHSYVFNKNSNNWEELLLGAGSFASHQELEPRTLDASESANYHQQLFTMCVVDLPKENGGALLYNDVSAFPIDSNLSIFGLKNGKFSVLMNEEDVISTHCTLGIESFKISPNKRYVAFVGKEVSSIDFVNKKRELWVADYTGLAKVYVYSLVSKDSYSKTFRGEINDFQISDDGTFYGVVSKSRLILSSPLKIIDAVSGHPHSEVDFQFWVSDAINTKSFKLPEPAHNLSKIIWFSDFGDRH